MRSQRLHIEIIIEDSEGSKCATAYLLSSDADYMLVILQIFDPNLGKRPEKSFNMGIS